MLAVSSLGFSQKKEGKSAPKYPTDVRVEADAVYLPDDRKEKADLYFPLEKPAGSRSPAILVIHGVDSNDGHKAHECEINISRTLALNGYLAMSVNYKLRRMKGQVT